jgi:2-oxoglutarate dehydrogenase E2 component (dihydrolipoamide succinyltransferase)
MAQVELIMPKMGESIMEATILNWLKKPGDKIEQDESVLEVATDKVDTEVPSTHAGVLKEILAKEGDVIKVGKPIAIISTESDTKNGSPQNTQTPAIAKAPVTSTETVKSANGSSYASTDFSGGTRFYSPLVKNIAREENITVAELETIPGSGSEGRVTKQDILNYVQKRGSGTVTKAPSTATVQAPKVYASLNSGDEIIEMDRMRKMIAERIPEARRRCSDLHADLYRGSRSCNQRFSNDQRTS